MQSANARNANQRGWMSLGVTILVALGLGAAQLVPQTELALLSERGTRASYEYAIYGSLKPLHLPVTLLFPNFYGLFDGPPREGFLPTAQFAYIGVPTLICILVALFASHHRRAVWFWTALALLSYALALGEYNPLYRALYEVVPGFAQFRWPTRWLVLTIFSAAILAAFGIEALQRTAPRARVAAIAGGVFLGTAGTLFLLLSGAPDVSLAGAWPQIGLVTLTTFVLAFLPSARKDAQSGATRSASTRDGAKSQSEEESRREAETKARQNIVESQRGAWTSMAPREYSQRAQRVAMSLLALLAADLLWMSQSMEMQHTLSVAALETKPASVAFLESRAPRERFWTSAPPIPLEAWQTGASSDATEFRARSAAALREMMPSCMASEFSVLGLTGAWGSLMPTRRNARPL